MIKMHDYISFWYEFEFDFHWKIDWKCTSLILLINFTSTRKTICLYIDHRKFNPYPLFLFGFIDVQVPGRQFCFSDNFLGSVNPQREIFNVFVEALPHRDGVLPAPFPRLVLSVQLAPTRLNLGYVKKGLKHCRHDIPFEARAIVGWFWGK